MTKRVLIAITVLMMIIVTALVLWLTVRMPCATNTCTTAGWVYDFQTLLAGIFAFVGGLTVLAAVGIELWERGNALERTRQEFRHAAVGDVIHRCTEMQAMLDNFKEASTPGGEPADMVKYLQEVWRRWPNQV